MLFEAYGIKVGDPLSLLLTRGWNLAFPPLPSGILEVTLLPLNSQESSFHFLFQVMFEYFWDRFFAVTLWGG